MPQAILAGYRLFPYERVLAERELAALTGRPAEPSTSGFAFDGPSDRVVTRSTYFDRVRAADVEEATTEQSSVERLHRRAGEAAPVRQATRYGLHGIHEYKGKFNPQVVRALTNVVDVDADILIDPFCGSGTALLEAVRLGLNTTGIDRSPIAVHLAQAKLRAALHRRPTQLKRDFSRLVRGLATDMKEAQQQPRLPTLGDTFDPERWAYLAEWFTPEVLAPLSAAVASLRDRRATVAGALGEVALSSILREISLQLPEDLRVRRRPAPDEAPPVWELFLHVCDRIERGLEEMAEWTRRPKTSGSVVLGSSDELKAFAGTEAFRRRFILTSPPYATALPYIDTDRLSLATLELASVTEIRALEMTLIGSREWRRTEEAVWISRLDNNAEGLPPDIVTLIEDIRGRNREAGAGFRRTALPALLYRYFSRMAACLTTWADVLQPGEHAVLIVGNNRTTAGGTEITIRTPVLLAQIAERREFKVAEILPLETWPRYGLHGHNGVRGEDAVVLCRL